MQQCHTLPGANQPCLQFAVRSIHAQNDVSNFSQPRHSCMRGREWKAFPVESMLQPESPSVLTMHRNAGAAYAVQSDKFDMLQVTGNGLHPSGF